jgi:cell wall-associated NlpC family hydrolase
LRSPGQPLDPATRAFMESRFGHDFGQVRLHTDARSAGLAWDLRARAYTIGTDIAFGTGQYAPETSEGRHLLAHELAHVVQQRQGASLKIRMSSLRDFNDKDQMHEPSKVADTQIEATDEFKAYMDPKLIWQRQLKVTRDEALLASRLILREMRDGKAVTWENQAREFIVAARKQLGTLKATEKLIGKLAWVLSQKSAFESPATAESDFTRWLLAGGPEPTDTGKMNCFEMVIFGAFRGHFISKDRMQKIYKEAAKKISYMDAPEEVEKNLCKGPKRTFDPSDSKSPEPLPGDIIIFGSIAKHAAISLGTKKKKQHQVISLAGAPDPTLSRKVEETTIEELLTRTDFSTVKFCTSSW